MFIPHPFSTVSDQFPVKNPISPVAGHQFQCQIVANAHAEARNHRSSRKRENVTEPRTGVARPFARSVKRSRRSVSMNANIVVPTKGFVSFRLLHFRRRRQAGPRVDTIFRYERVKDRGENVYVTFFVRVLDNREVTNRRPGLANREFSQRLGLHLVKEYGSTGMKEQVWTVLRIRFE